jgi:hypothetical protein
MTDPTPPAPDVDLPGAPEEDPQLRKALEEASQRTAGMSRVTMGLAAGLLAVTCFGGGWYVGNQGGDDQPTAAPQFSGPGGLNEGLPNGAQPGGRSPGDFTSGTVDSIDGETITITTPDGRKVKVNTDDDTSVTVSEPGSVSDLAEGDTVVVTGDAGDDGSIDADSVTEGQTPFMSRSDSGPAT